MIQYEIEVKTGVLHGAGTDHKVYIEIVGSNGRTRLRKLDHIAINDFKRNQTDRYTKEDNDVGKVEFIGLLLKPITTNLIEDPWYVETVKIGRKIKAAQNERDYDTVKELIVVWEEFPIFSWLMPRYEIQYFFNNKTSIPQKETETRKYDKMRVQQVMKDVVNWMPREKKLKKFPGYIDVTQHDKLDLKLRFTDDKDRDFNANRRKVLRTAAFGTLRNKFKDFYNFEDYEYAARHLRGKVDGLPYLQNNLWKTDEEFGRQVLNGMNPSIIQRCKMLPENFPVDNSTVSKLLTRGLTLEDEIEQGNIYIIDHKVLQGISTGYFPFGSDPEYGKKLELAVPLCLLYNDSQGTLRPIAIQLGQEPGPRFPIWTPNDGESAWLLAKIWFRSADYQVHQMRAHLAYTHLLVEPIAVATFRCLPPQHPVFKLLRQHLQFVIAINTIGRARLIAPVIKENYIK